MHRYSCVSRYMQNIIIDHCGNATPMGSVESLYSLLPPKKSLQRLQKTHKPNKYTGFAVKSYRNPNSADIIACFPEHRAKTVLGVFTTGSRVHYAPHYFKYFSPMYTPVPTTAATPVDIDANSTGRDIWSFCEVTLVT
ncbi:hypothetical protein LSAT2_004703 [Lamellibrachia satsuma]|nr:hypothetical protein LSAT2_004703 [Lamellibrachia satsuma]